MKPPEELTDEELRVEIAEFCGLDKFSIYGICRTCQGDDSKTTCPDCDLDGFDGYLICPNYPQDLNAMWEVAQFIKGQSGTTYARYLTNLRKQFSVAVGIFAIDATPKQRAIAFVKTIRKINR